MTFAKLFAIVGLAFFALGLIYHWFKTKQLPRPVDKARPKGDEKVGILYAFTIGMMPWTKESTRRHWLAYIRGVIFHIGIFTGLFSLLMFVLDVNFNANLKLILAMVTGIGGVMGLVGILMRLFERNLRLISTIDDYLSVALVSVFLLLISAAFIDAKFVVPMYLTSAVTLIYAPIGKIRHCLYFFFSRFFFGIHLGRRGIVHRYREVSYGK